MCPFGASTPATVREPFEDTFFLERDPKRSHACLWQDIYIYIYIYIMYISRIRHASNPPLVKVSPLEDSIYFPGPLTAQSSSSLLTPHLMHNQGFPCSKRNLQLQCTKENKHIPQQARERPLILQFWDHVWRAFIGDVPTPSIRGVGSYNIHANHRNDRKITVLESGTTTTQQD